MPKPLIVANWKMNNTVQESLIWTAGIQHHLKVGNVVDVAVAPSFTSLYSVGVALADTGIDLAAQNMHWEDRGAFTGEVSGVFLKDVGCKYVILGHSERRWHSRETNEEINKKISAALRHDIIPILCVGETIAERDAGRFEEVLETQLKNCLGGLHMRDLADFVAAYEPVWAIGTGKNASPEQAEEAHHFIRNWIAKKYDSPTANQVRILYGGSVKASNAKEILLQPNVDGALVGGASLDPKGFSDIIAQAVHKER